MREISLDRLPGTIYLIDFGENVEDLEVSEWTKSQIADYFRSFLADLGLAIYVETHPELGEFAGRFCLNVFPVDNEEAIVDLVGPRREEIIDHQRKWINGKKYMVTMRRNGHLSRLKMVESELLEIEEALLDVVEWSE